MVMVRNPVEACHSLYRQNRYAGIEPLETFEESLAAEAERATWTTPPKHCHLEQLLYRRVYAFAENIARYHAAFGEDRVHVTLLEDMRADPQGELAKVWSFLGLDPIEVPAEVRNRGTKRAVLPGLVRFAISPPPWLGRVLSFVPKERRVQVREALKRLGTSA